MTLEGFIAMLSALASVTGLFAWCLWRVIKTPGETKHIHGIEQSMVDKDL